MALDRNSLNKVILIGHLGADPDVRYTQDNRPVANLSLATNEVYNDRDGNRQENTQWHRIVVFGKQAEVVENYFKKGKLIYVEGRLRTRQYEDQNGNTRYITEVVAQNLNMLGRKDDMAGGGTPSQSNQQGAAQETQQQGPGNGEAPDLESDADDDLPF